MNVLAELGLTHLDGLSPNRHEQYAAAWLVGYRNDKTRAGYAVCVKRWFAFAARMGFDPMAAVRAHVELWQREAELEGLMPRTIVHRLVSLSSFYDYCVDEDLLEKSPMRGVRRPKVERKSPTAWLRRTQLADLIEGARVLGPYPHATVTLYALTGLRVNEGCTADIEGIHFEDFYPKLWVHRKGGADQAIALPLPVHAALQVAHDGRMSGPLLLTRAGTRMTQASVQRILDQAMRNVRGDHGRITPHSLRHSFATAGLDAGVSPEQLAHDAGWVDGRMLAYYSHGKDAAMKSTAHQIAGFVMSA